MPYRSRIIPPTVINGVGRGGGSESINYVSSNHMLLIRNHTAYKNGSGIHPGMPGLSSNLHVRTFINPHTLGAGTDLNDSQVKAMGTTAMARSAPSSPSVSLLTSAGELALDGIPLLPKVAMWRTETLKALSNAHLSVQFGWLPIKADIEAYAKQVKEFDDILEAAKSQSQKNVIKVGYTFPTDRTSEYYNDVSLTRDWASGASFGDPGRTHFTRSFFQKVWFEAKYLNYLHITPFQETALKRAVREADLLLGLELTPEVVWNITPWSWAVDWFSNAGDVIAAASRNLSDGMVMSNGYVMKHYRKEAIAERQGPIKHSTKGVPYWSGGERVMTLQETKRRFRSIPYFGFGTAGGLSNKQLSILAALGISRVR
jgi:hypothetical protein